MGKDKAKSKVADSQKPARNTGAAMIRADLVEMLAELAAIERRAVWEIVEDSPFRIWLLERYLLMKSVQEQRFDDAKKQLAELKAKQKS